jgi:hypothetical protein
MNPGMKQPLEARNTLSCSHQENRNLNPNPQGTGSFHQPKHSAVSLVKTAGHRCFPGGTALEHDLSSAAW